MKSIRSFGTLILILLLIPACTTTKGQSRDGRPLTIKPTLPSWTSSGKDLRYPDQLFITATGEGGSMETADKMAIIRVAEQIRISIKSELTLSQKANDRDGVVESSRDLSQTIDTSVDIKNLEAISIVMRHHDRRNNIHYSFAALDRDKAASALIKKINDHYGLANEYFMTAERHRRNVEIAEAIPNYIRAAEEHRKGNAPLQLLNIISSNAGNKDIIKAESAAIMEGRLIEIISKCRIEKVRGNMQRGKFGEALKKPLQVLATYEHSGRNYPVQRLPLKFTILEGSGMLQQEVSTDFKGHAKTIVSRVNPSGIRNNIIEATLNYNEDSIPASLPRTHFTFILPVKEDIKIRVSISESNLGKKINPSVVKPAIVKELKARGFNVLEGSSGKADFTVKGKVKSSKKGNMGDIIFAISTGSVSILDNKTGLIAQEVKISEADSKGGGLSLKAAGLNSLQMTGTAVGQKVAKEMEGLFNRPDKRR